MSWTEPSIRRVSSSRVWLVVGKKPNPWATHPVVDLALKVAGGLWTRFAHIPFGLEICTSWTSYVHVSIHICTKDGFILCVVVFLSVVEVYLHLYYLLFLYCFLLLQVLGPPLCYNDVDSWAVHCALRHSSWLFWCDTDSMTSPFPTHPHGIFYYRLQSVHDISDCCGAQQQTYKWVTLTITEAVNFSLASHDLRNSQIWTISANFYVFPWFRRLLQIWQAVLTFMINHQKFLMQFISIINDALVNTH